MYAVYGCMHMLRRHCLRRRLRVV